MFSCRQNYVHNQGAGISEHFYPSTPLPLEPSRNEVVSNKLDAPRIGESQGVDVTLRIAKEIDEHIDTAAHPTPTTVLVFNKNRK